MKISWVCMELPTLRETVIIMVHVHQYVCRTPAFLYLAVGDLHLNERTSLEKQLCETYT